MATQVQFRGGTTTEHASFTGAAREVTVDTTKDTVVVHDGTTQGGFPLAKEASPTFTGDVSIPDKIIHTGDTNTAIRFPSADTFTVETGGTEAVRINSSQSLLIGPDGAPTTTITSAGAATFAGVCDATCFTGDVNVSYGHKERTAEGDINVPYDTWTTIDTDYGWDLPGAGTYKLSAFLRVKVWDTDAYVNSRASGSAGNSNPMILFESNDGAGEYNISATPFWVYTATGSDNVKCQFNTNDNTTGTGIQNDTNGRNSFYWERIG